MLIKLHQVAHHPLLKLVLGIIVIGFLGWGVRDMLSIATPDAMVQVGSHRIQPNEYRTMLQREMQHIQHIAGHALTPEQLKLFNIEGVTLHKLINRYLLLSEAEKLGVFVGPNTVGAYIRSMPEFLDAKGLFSKQKFQYLLSREGINEAFLVNALTKDIPMEFLISGIISAPLHHPLLASHLFTHRYEQRVIDHLILTDDYLATAPAPSEEDISSYYDQHREQFTLPEYRRFEYILFTPSSLAEHIQVTDEEIERAYEERKEQFTTPAQRDVAVLTCATEADAKEAYIALTRGDAIDSVAKQWSRTSGDKVYRRVTRDALADPLEEWLFQLPVGVISDPYQHDEVWYVAKVLHTSTETVQPLEQVRKTLAVDLKSQKTEQYVEKQLTALEDSIAAGTPLSEVAEQFKIAIHRSAWIDAKGHDKRGHPQPELLKFHNLISTAFNTPVSTTSALTQASDQYHYIAVTVEGVEEAHLPPLETIRKDVEVAWKKQAREQALEQAAYTLVEALKKGESLSAVTGNRPYKIKKNITVGRPEGLSVAALPETMVQDVFQVPVGGYTVPHQDGQGAYHIAHVHQHLIPDTTKEAHKWERLQQEVTAHISDEFIELYMTALRAHTPVTVYRTSLEAPAE